MLHDKSRLIVCNGEAEQRELQLGIGNLPDGDYTVLIMDDAKNKSLPQLKYLFGVVLKTISDQLPTHPTVDALYRYFEEVYAPIHTCNLPGESFEYFNLKGEKSSEVNEIIDKIIHHAKDEWGIDILSKNDAKTPEAKEAWAGAYTDQWSILSNKS